MTGTDATPADPTVADPTPVDLTSVEPGHRLPGRTVHVTRATLVAYAGASLDRNPIHWDDRFAQDVGLPDVIAHGMWTMGVAMQLVVDWCGDAGRVVECSTKFVAPVVVPHDCGADVELGGVVRSVTDGRATVEVSATCRGKKVLGRALAVIRL
ncbi:MaoC/PaaZ C-terminal domain-containing protein [Arsenicicoccus dermatophilus]|uniref:MaoC/PaaZ C-terminal domain-containing protein n=1 Tax=Arsenicicoccus dermatophilus TaxID=1076331 RepID=UPI0039175E29